MSLISCNSFATTITGSKFQTNLISSVSTTSKNSKLVFSVFLCSRMHLGFLVFFLCLWSFYRYSHNTWILFLSLQPKGLTFPGCQHPPFFQLVLRRSKLLLTPVKASISFGFHRTRDIYVLFSWSSLFRSSNTDF